jgi:peptidoglycan/LPS O-acetylase OafA/YrhL
VLWTAGRPGAEQSSQPHPPLAARLAGFSYSLYLIHVPVCFLVAAAVLQHYATAQRLQPQPAAFALYTLGLALAVAVAFLMSRLTEARTDVIRHWVGRRLAGRAVVARKLAR